MTVHAIPIQESAATENFDERGYLNANPDIAAAVHAGAWESGRAHFAAFGAKEGRPQISLSRITQSQAEKIERIKSFLKLERPHARRGIKYDFLTDELRRETGISDTDVVSRNHYDPNVQALINEMENGLVLDCGAGSRDSY
jgi:hypothetical protein